MKALVKIIISFFLLVAIILPNNNASAFNFTDVDLSHKNRVAIEYLSLQEIFKGQDNGSTFDPHGFINRAEWSMILSRHTGVNPGPDQYDNCLSDISGQWFAATVCYAHEQGWVKGYQAGPEAGKFMPVYQLNTSEILVILSRVHDWPLEEGLYWYSGAMAYAQEANLINSEHSYDQALTRSQAAEILFRSITVDNYAVNKYEPLLGELLLSEGPTDSENTDLNQDSTESIIVSLSGYSDEAVEATVPKGALYVPVLRFQLHTDKTTTLNQLSVKRVSVSRVEDLSIGRLMINGKIIKERSFSSDDQVHWSGLNYLLIPNRPYILEMNVDFKPDALPILDYQFQLSPDKFEFRESNVEVQGDTLTGQSFVTSSLEIEKIIVTNHESKLKIPYVESANEIIGKFVIKAGAKDVLIRRIKLEDAGNTSSSDVQNYRLSAGSQELSFLAQLDHYVLDFSLDNFFIKGGQEKTFTVRADILSPRKAYNIRLFISQPEDIYAYNLEYGFGVQVDNQFSYDTAWCLGSDTSVCPGEGFRKRCSDDDIENKVTDCVDTQASSSDDGSTTSEHRTPADNCDTRMATVCGEIEGKEYTFINLCHAEFSRATGIVTGPCSSESIICRDEFAPVCGQIEISCEIPPCSLKTHSFSNQCQADQAAATNITTGKCAAW